MRNCDNYENDVIRADVSNTGIKERCVWNSVNSFYVTENCAVDIAHDIFEGLALFDIVEILHGFVIVDKLFTIESLNSRMRYFQYGNRNRNKPPLIRLDSLKKKKLMSWLR